MAPIIGESIFNNVDVMSEWVYDQNIRLFAANMAVQVERHATQYCKQHTSVHVRKLLDNGRASSATSWWVS